MHDLLLIFIIYITLLIIFQVVEDNMIKLILFGALYIYTANVLGDGNYLIYLGIGLAASLTEAICINYFSNTWRYESPDSIGIPYWLIPLWSITAIFVVKVYNILKNYDLQFD